jgi:hypothetical protein
MAVQLAASQGGLNSKKLVNLHIRVIYGAVPSFLKI